LNTRFAKLDESDWAGMILAHAGVVRLGWKKRISQILSIEKMLPAVGQGALGIETRTDDSFINEIVLKLNHRATEISTKGERSLLRYLEGGCQIPIGAFGRIENGLFKLDALIGSLDGKRIVRDSIEGKPEDSEKLGIKLAERLLKNGGDEILKEIR
jgi:hydroxymethylbilane synthase